MILISLKIELFFSRIIAAQENIPIKSLCQILFDGKIIAKVLTFTLVTLFDFG